MAAPVALLTHLRGQLDGEGPGSVIIFAGGVYDGNFDIEFGVGPHYTNVEFSWITLGAIGGAPSYIFSLQGFDEASSTWENLISSAAVVSAASGYISINPDLPAVTNVSAPRVPRRRMRVHGVNSAGAGNTLNIAGTVHAM